CAFIHHRIETISITPNETQKIAFRCSPANQYPAAALKQRTPLVQPLPHAAGLLIAFRKSIRPLPPTMLPVRIPEGTSFRAPKPIHDACGHGNTHAECTMNIEE